MTNRPELPGTDLDTLLARARAAAPPSLPPGLQARLLADAAAVQAAPRAVPVRRPGRLWQWLADLGGLPGLAGMSAAGIAGLWIGLADPLPGLQVSALLGEGASALIAGADAGADLGDSPFDIFDPLD